jgi:UDP-GlcNAc:undecaprenyl-phosphate/decaprenyl-phosphate GlcNAc-1-phosphate transferase
VTGPLLLAAFLGALGGAALLTPLSMALARRCGALDHPDPRKVHAAPTPRWGGFAIFGGFLLAAAVLWSLSPAFGALLAHTPKASPAGLGRQFSGILLASALVWLLGTVDDRRPLGPLPKLFVQAAAAWVATAHGVLMTGVSLPGQGFVAFPPWLSQALTFLWIIGFMNVVNLADGLDGLAAGICAIAAGTFVVVCLVQGDKEAAFFSRQLQFSAVLSAALCGASVGFLVYNFPPAGVFMGDGGALFLGFMLGAVSLTGTLKTGALISVVIPLLAVALPVTDTAFALLRRWRNGRGLLQADRGHFHHRLLARGWTPREVTLLVYVITLLLSMATILLALFKSGF